MEAGSIFAFILFVALAQYPFYCCDVEVATVLLDVIEHYDVFGVA